MRLARPDNRKRQQKEESSMKSERTLAWTGLAVVAALVVAACTTVRTTESGVVGVTRQQTFSSMLSAKEMETGSAQAYQKIIGEAAPKGALNRDPAQVQRVRNIATRIIPHTAVFRKDAPAWKWEVNVLSSDQINAWCMPGGKIAFYTGILDKLQLTDDEAAAIMGHEIAHALREHGRERASQAVNQQLTIGILGAVLGVGQVGQDLMGQAASLAIGLPNSRGQESEADIIGVELAARAGYDPRAAVTLWQKMAKQSGGNAPPQWLSTHPAAETRIRELEVYSAKVMPLYEQARRGGR